MLPKKCDNYLSVVHRGNGFFLHPYLTVSKLGDKKLGKTEFHKREIELDFIVAENMRIIVTDDGFICPITTLGDEEIHKFLNVIISTLITKGIASVQISWERDWVNFQYEEGQKFIEIGWSRGAYSIRNQFEFERDDENTFHLWNDIPRTPIMTDELKSHIERAYDFYTNPEYSDDLLLIGQAWNLSWDGMHQASFLYGWMIIENMIEQTLEKYINSLNILPKEKKFMKSHYWKISQSIDGLALAGKIDEVTKKTLEKLKEIRNGIVHDRNSVSNEESWECMNVATELVYNKLNYDDSYLMHSTPLRRIT